jgi:hypothetical protein
MTASSARGRCWSATPRIDNGELAFAGVPERHFGDRTFDGRGVAMSLRVYRLADSSGR